MENGHRNSGYFPIKNGGPFQFAMSVITRPGTAERAQLRKYKIAEIALSTSLRAARQQRVPLSAILQREEQVVPWAVAWVLYIETSP